ncbi:MAG: hypothetical protein AAF378_19850 [Cyanobacteria bacterium P01_A01_bin.84]
MKRLLQVVVTILALIGSIQTAAIISSIINISFNSSSATKSEPLKCIDASLDYLDSAYINGKHYELITYTTGFADKVHFVELHERKNRRGECVLSDKSIDSQNINYGSEGEAPQQFPKLIIIKNNKITIQYTDDRKESNNINNVPVVWEDLETSK